MSKVPFYVAALLLLSRLVYAQPAEEYLDDPVLFTVAHKPVRVSEFVQIYTKSNQQKADFSEASLREYLDLYIKFKLKVQRARDMRLDTVSTFRNELDMYRRQLAAAYLVDREVTEKLVREAYEHMKQDVEVSHILIACDRNTLPADTLRAFRRATALLEQLRKGADFARLARDSSEDNSTKENGGYIGFVTALLPDGYYWFEKAIYSAQPGIIPYVVRSHHGYHIIKVHGFRPARGEVEVAHILIRKGDSEEANYLKRQRADSAYLAAQRMPWEEACMLYSEDQASAPRGGYVGSFGINRYQRSFEEAAFALEKDGDISPPVETSVGWHIIKRLSRRPIPPFEEMRRALSERIKRDSRNEVARRSFIQRIQQEADFREYPDNLQAWAARQVDSIFHTFRWKPDSTLPDIPLIRYGDRIYTVADFEAFLVRSSRERMRGLGHPIEQTIASLYQAWVDETALAYEEAQLDKKYPEFRHLMREYEEGMLLFDAAKIEVWDRANTDSVGLERYFNEHLKNKYLWDERAVVSFYTLKSDDSTLLKKVREYAVRHEPEAVLKKFNKKGEVLVRLEKTYEKGRNKDLETIWRPGGMSEAKRDAATKTASFIKVERLLPPSPKALSEARGYAVADYQDYLEKRWVEQLRAQYPVEIREEVFRALVK